MEQLKDRWLRLLNEYDDAVIDNQQQADTAPYTVLSSVDTSAEDTTVDDDLPIYTATYKEISYWHACCNGFLQDLLRQYDLGWGSPSAFSHFQIGIDEKRHLATFAIAIDKANDKALYYAFEFDKYNAAPLDNAEARRVLEKVSELRRQRSYRKEFCGYMLEYFDDVTCADVSVGTSTALVDSGRV